MLLEEVKTAPGALGLQAATMGNGVCRAVPSLGNGTANSSSIRGLADFALGHVQEAGDDPRPARYDVD